MNRLLLDNNKQGMQGVQLMQINQVIQDETYGSAKYELEQRKELKSNEKSRKLTIQYKQLTSNQIDAARIKVDNEIEQLQQQFEPKILAVTDFDCFYAEVEMRDNPFLRDKPLAIVGGSIVDTSNYIARKYGVRAAMPVKVAKSLCANLVCIEANMDKYLQVSRSCAPVFAKYDQSFQMLSGDECCLDITQKVYEKMNAPSVKEQIQQSQLANGQKWEFLMKEPSVVEHCAAIIMQELRNDIEKHTQLTVSCGIGLSKELAKIGADMKKPDGQTIFKLKFASRSEMFEDFKQELGVLPIRKIWGIGQATQELLQQEPFNVTTISGIVEKQYIIAALLPPSSIQLTIAAHGLQNITGFSSEDEMKSVGHDRTIPECGDLDYLLQITLELSKMVCIRLEKYDHVPARLLIHLRFADWSDELHIEDLPRRSRDLDVIYTKAKQMVVNLYNSAKQRKIGLVTVGLGSTRRDVPAYYVRLVGVRCTAFESTREGQIDQFISPGRSYEQVKATQLESKQDEFEVVGSRNNGGAQKKAKTGAIDKFLRK